MDETIRVGLGYDIHKFVKGRKLILGGVEIPYTRGLLGDSDADALTHAIIDALLGAASLSDIGHYFPPGDNLYKGASSLDLLRKIKGVLDKNGVDIINLDTVVVLEEPHLSPFIDEIQHRIARQLNISTCSINIKATTNKGIGPIGNKETVAVYAIALVRKKTKSSSNSEG